MLNLKIGQINFEDMTAERIGTNGNSNLNKIKRTENKKRKRPNAETRHQIDDDSFSH